jgi:hypothetical protein
MACIIKDHHGYLQSIVCCVAIAAAALLCLPSSFIANRRCGSGQFGKTRTKIDLHPNFLPRPPKLQYPELVLSDKAKLLSKLLCLMIDISNLFVGEKEAV